MASNTRKRRRQRQDLGSGNRTPSVFKAQMEELRQQRKQIKDRDARREAARKHRAAESKFRAWQHQLCTLIRNHSRMEFVEQDGGVVFVLPKELVRLVWATTIRQRAAVERAKGMDNREATAHAMDELANQLTSAASTLTPAREQQEPQHNPSPAV